MRSFKQKLLDLEKSGVTRAEMARITGKNPNSFTDWMNRDIVPDPIIQDFVLEKLGGGKREKLDEEMSKYQADKFEKWFLELREKWNHPSFCVRDAARNIMQLTFKPETFTEIMQWLEKKDGGGVQGKRSFKS